jgi:DNA-binding MarR family transcriptional regulator
MTRPNFGFMSDLLGFRLKQANQVLLGESEKRLRPLGISPQHFSVLAMVSLNPGIIQSRLIDNLYITRSTCSDLIEQLIQRGLMQRTPIDRRSNGLSLTEKGQKLLAQARVIVEQNGQDATAHMDPADVAELVRLLAVFSQK